MLKEYTLKVTVRVGGESGADCDQRLAILMYQQDHDNYEITHEQVVEPEVERE